MYLKLKAYLNRHDTVKFTVPLRCIYYTHIYIYNMYANEVTLPGTKRYEEDIVLNWKSKYICLYLAPIIGLLQSIYEHLNSIILQNKIEIYSSSNNKIYI